MRFFRSRISDQVHPCAAREVTYFVTSEQFVGSDGTAARRKYSVRVAAWSSGHVDTVEGFQNYSTSAAAHRAARKLAEQA